MKTVITGASGHLGANLVRALLSKGREVRALSHRSNLGLEGLPVEYCRGDIADSESLVTAFQGCEVVYHLATHISLLMSDWPECERINVAGTRNVVEACRRVGVRRLVHMSSIHALETEPADIPVDESRPLIESLKAPPYDRSKAAGEKVVLQAVKYGLNAVIIRPTGIIGPHDYRPSHFGQVLLMIASGKLPVLVGGGFDWVDARDVAEYATKAEEMSAPGSNYIFSGHWVSVREMAQTVVSIREAKCPTLTCPVSLARAAVPFAIFASRLAGRKPVFTQATLNALMSNRNISHARATRELGYHPRSFHDTLADTIRWFEDNGFLKARYSNDG